MTEFQEEGVRAVQKKESKTTEKESVKKSLKLDAKKLVLYSEIMKPKFF